MQSENKPEFTKLLAASMLIYDRQITTAIVDIFFSAMAQYPLETVREALSRHLQDPDAGRFAPKPADLIRQIVNAKNSDGRPGRDEAWAIAQIASCENETLAVTREILGALQVSEPLLRARDKVAARMAFVEAYDRLVAESRSSGLPNVWHMSFGDDKTRRSAAIRAAKEAGRIGAQQAEQLLIESSEDEIGSPGLAIVGLLSGPSPKNPDELRARWQEIKRGLQQKKDGRSMRERESIREAEKELSEISARKNIASDRGREDEH